MNFQFFLAEIEKSPPVKFLRRQSRLALAKKRIASMKRRVPGTLLLMVGAFQNNDRFYTKDQLNGTFWGANHAKCRFTDFLRPFFKLVPLESRATETHIFFAQQAHSAIF